MSKYLRVVLIVFIFSPLLKAQKGTAPNGYYPGEYQGAIFTGSLEAVTAENQEMTLVYTKGSKTERFVGRLESKCGWKDKTGTAHEFEAPDIPKGTVLTAFYITETKKSGGQKTKENLVFAISYAEVGGKKIPEERRITIYCSERRMLNFKAY